MMAMMLKKLLVNESTVLINITIITFFIVTIITAIETPSRFWHPTGVIDADDPLHRLRELPRARVRTVKGVLLFFLYYSSE